jgi:2-polyprenyl-3-methyl-5-hydroxy-6-metoxy-1,4-benzoquinol methylase
MLPAYKTPMDQHLSSETVSKAYTQSDHLSRKTDRYAQSKYTLTNNWIAPHVRPGQTLFNIGCGNGQFNFMAAEHGLEVWGFEPDPETFKLADIILNGSESLGVEQKSHIHLSPQNLFEIPTEGKDAKKTDYVVMHDVLEHLENDVEAVERLSCLLRPSGIGVVSVPAMPSLFGFHDEQLGHFRRYTADTLRKVLETRFRVEKIRYFGASFIPVVYWFSVKQRKPYPHTTASTGLPSKILSGLCSAEERFPLPIGTSVMAQVRLRK